MPDFQILIGDALEQLRTLPENSVDCVVTSPPYWGLRDYGHIGQMGIERTPEEYVSGMSAVFREVHRVLKPNGTLWLNLGDSYTSGGRTHRRDPDAKNTALGLGSQRLDTPEGLKPKDLVGIPWRVAFALQASGWYLRSDIIWSKPNPMPESVTDRPTKAHEYVFLLSKTERYFYDHEAVKEDAVSHLFDKRYSAGHSRDRNTEDWNREGAIRPHNGFKVNDTTNGRNRRSVWVIQPRPFKDAHFAVMPEELAGLCILAGCPEGGTVLDPFAGSGTVGAVSLRHGRSFIGIELNPAYASMASNRITAAVPGPSLFLNTETSA